MSNRVLNQAKRVHYSIVCQIDRCSASHIGELYSIYGTIPVEAGEGTATSPPDDIQVCY